jgi:hypothetical protein
MAGIVLKWTKIVKMGDVSKRMGLRRAWQVTNMQALDKCMHLQMPLFHCETTIRGA